MLASNVKVIQPKKLFNIEENAKRILRVAGYARVDNSQGNRQKKEKIVDKKFK